MMRRLSRYAVVMALALASVGCAARSVSNEAGVDPVSPGVRARAVASVPLPNLHDPVVRQRFADSFAPGSFGFPSPATSPDLGAIAVGDSRAPAIRVRSSSGTG